jgi:Zn finger protein HypA/HybF involved in hydrogenase expression
METVNDLVRCVNCWEGFEWQSKSDERTGRCPRCGKEGEVIDGGFLVFAPKESNHPADHARRRD